MREIDGGAVELDAGPASWNEYAKHDCRDEDQVDCDIDRVRGRIAKKQVHEFSFSRQPGGRGRQIYHESGLRQCLRSLPASLVWGVGA